MKDQEFTSTVNLPTGPQSQDVVVSVPETVDEYIAIYGTDVTLHLCEKALALKIQPIIKQNIKAGNPASMLPAKFKGWTPAMRQPVTRKSAKQSLAELLSVMTAEEQKAAMAEILAQAKEIAKSQATQKA